MLRGLNTVFSSSCKQKPASAWLQCVAGLQALHDAAAAAGAAAAAAGLQGSSATAAACHQQKQQQKRRLVQYRRFSTDEPQPRRSEQHGFQQAEVTKSNQLSQQLQDLLQQRQQQHQQQDNQLEPQDMPTVSVSGYISSLRRQQHPSKRQMAPSLEDQLQMLEQHREQQLLRAVKQQQQRQEQQQQTRGRRHKPISDSIEQEINSRSLQRWLASPNAQARESEHRADSAIQQQQQQQQQAQAQAEWAAGSRPATFSALGVDRRLVQTLLSMNIHTPTPVQVDAYPAVMSGRNCSLQSATGTGKTLSYLLPLLTRLQPWHPDNHYRSKYPRVVILCPTQELCVQVLRTARSLLPLKTSYAQPLVGGSSITKAAEAMKRHGPVLLTATPGRLKQLLSRRPVMRKPVMRPGPDWREEGGLSVTLVLEEADRLCAMDDFKLLLPWLDGKARGSHIEPGTPPTLAQHMKNILNAYQVILVSASLRETSLQTAKAWLDTDPIRVRSEAPADSTPAARAAAAAVSLAANPKSEWAQMLPDTITHQVLLYDSLQPSRQQKQLKALLRLYAREGKKVLVFAKPGQSPVELSTQLKKLSGDTYQVSALHGQQQGQQRANTLAQFNHGKLHALVTSDAFGLGLDYKDVDVVLNLDDIAPTAQAYVARAGRTGRMGRPGTVLTLIHKRSLHKHKCQVKRITKSLQVMQLRADAPGQYVLEVQQMAEKQAHKHVSAVSVGAKVHKVAAFDKRASRQS